MSLQLQLQLQGSIAVPNLVRQFSTLQWTRLFFVASKLFAQLPSVRDSCWHGAAVLPHVVVSNGNAAVVQV